MYIVEEKGDLSTLKNIQRSLIDLELETVHCEYDKGTIRIKFADKSQYDLYRLAVSHFK